MKKREIDVVMALNYYAPYVSGLTDVARLVCEELVRRGMRVVVITCRHSPDLPRHEIINGVEVHRSPVLARVGKGLISPAYVVDAIRWGRRARVINLHLPMIEAGIIATALRSTPVVLTYHCDIALPNGLVNSMQTAVVDSSARLAMRAADAVVPTTADYAKHSRLRRPLTGPKAVVIPPPTRLRENGRPTYRQSDGPHVGFLGRIVEEKGLEYLVDAFRAIDDPTARLLIAGDYVNIAGGSVVEKVRAHIENDDRIRLLGFLAESDLANFYASIDAFALPSVNSFEAFGIVQVEAMRTGVPALASDLPGVRVPVELTGFGAIIRPRDVDDISTKMSQVLRSSFDRTRGAELASELFSTERVVDAYEELFRKLMISDTAN